MSLDTVIQIGRTIRQSDKALAYHRYVRKAPFANPKKVYRYFQFDVNDKFEIDIKSRKEIKDEDFITEKLFYLKYRTGEADTYVKYVFGDFCSDYFKYANPKGNPSSMYSKNSFDRGEGEAEKISLPIITKFRESLEKIIEDQLEFLRPLENWYVHFSFSGTHWHELEETYEKLNEAILSNFIKEENGKLSLSAFLVRTLIGASGSQPDFKEENTFKTRQFKNIEEVKDLLFGLNFYLGYKIREDDIMINMLPKGDLSAEDIIEFFKKKDKLEYNDEEVSANPRDRFLSPALDHDIKSIKKYDIIFSKESKPIGIDLLEINDVDKNLLKAAQEKIWKAKSEMEIEGFNTKFIGIKFSLKNLFDGKKYKNHLIRVLPKIYQNTYYQDALILPAFLQKAEYYTRNPDRSYKKFKDGRIPYLDIRKHFYFLIKMQKNNTLMAIKDTKSFRIGNLLGIMAEPFAAWRDNCPIKSFEKSYVGNLSRRISNKEDLVKFSNFLNEKLTIHNKIFPSIKKAFLELVELLGELNDKDYNKEYCEFGFFESYYSTMKKEKPEVVETSKEN